ncbi:hypothetical protein LR48_Vigan07g135400 [Vigna angularis]|uniref:Uncharacterized protein n=1 Tax=Phaseolus angularis TaxID=3914 RepID=A0A0L9UXR9_PHAAN|nr:hypothetical protein LR48_Vigan07g135400 [Vigna angularis]
MRWPNCGGDIQQSTRPTRGSVQQMAHTAWFGRQRTSSNFERTHVLIWLLADSTSVQLGKREDLHLAVQHTPQCTSAHIQHERPTKMKCYVRTHPARASSSVQRSPHLHSRIQHERPFNKRPGAIRTSSNLKRATVQHAHLPGGSRLEQQQTLQLQRKKWRLPPTYGSTTRGREVLRWQKKRCPTTLGLHAEKKRCADSQRAGGVQRRSGTRGLGPVSKGVRGSFLRWQKKKRSRVFEEVSTKLRRENGNRSSKLGGAHGD